MKTITLSLLLFGSALFAQASCNDIKIKVKEMQGDTIYTVSSKLVPYNMIIHRVINARADVKMLTFSVITYSCSFIGLYVKLSNGEVLRFPENRVTCNSSIFKDGRRSLRSVLIMTPEIIEKLSVNQIVKFNIGGDDYDIKENAQNLQLYVGCMFK